MTEFGASIMVAGVPHDPRLGGKRRTKLTKDEEESYAAAYLAALDDSFTILDAERAAWILLQRNYPRLRDYDAAERSNG